MAVKGIPQRNTNRQLNLKFYISYFLYKLYPKRVHVISCQTEVETHVQQWVSVSHLGTQYPQDDQNHQIMSNRTSFWRPSILLSPRLNWLVVYLPLWKKSESQLGLLFPIYGKS